METRRIRRLVRAVPLLLAIPSGVAAHEFWLAPSAYRGAAADTIVVRAYVGTGFRGEVKPYAATRARRFELRAAKTLDLRPVGANGDLVFARLVLPDAGGALVAYQSDFSFIELEADKFDDYLRTEGLDAVLAARQAGGAPAPGRERYARCCKTWIAGSDTRRLLDPVGLTLEIVPLADPLAAATLPVRVLYRGAPLAGALVRAWNQRAAADGTAPRDSVGPAFATRTDKDGGATLQLPAAGEWLVNAVHMVPSAGQDADWESWWASLTFARPAAAAATPEAATAARRSGSRR